MALMIVQLGTRQKMVRFSINCPVPIRFGKWNFEFSLAKKKFDCLRFELGSKIFHARSNLLHAY